MPNTGPRDGSRSATTAFFPIFRRPSARPTVVVVLPSPAGVGVMAVTSTSLPSGRTVSFRNRLSIFALYLPYCSRYASSTPHASAMAVIGRGLASWAISMSLFRAMAPVLLSGRPQPGRPVVLPLIIMVPVCKSNRTAPNPPLFLPCSADPVPFPPVSPLCRGLRPPCPVICLNDSRLVEIGSGHSLPEDAIILHREGWIPFQKSVYSDEPGCMRRGKRT